MSDRPSSKLNELCFEIGSLVWERDDRCSEVIVLRFLGGVWRSEVGG